MAYSIKQILPLVKEYYYNKGLISINMKMFQKHFYKLQDNINQSGLTPEQYLEAATFETIEENIRGQIIFPRLLASSYILRKVCDYWGEPTEDVALKSYTLACYNFIHSKKQIGKGYFKVDKTIPDFLTDIKHWNVSLIYCLMQNEFIEAIKKLDIDIYEEYLGEFDLKSIKNTIYLDNALYNTIRNI